MSKPICDHGLSGTCCWSSTGEPYCFQDQRAAYMGDDYRYPNITVEWSEDGCYYASGAGHVRNGSTPTEALDCLLTAIDISVISRKRKINHDE